MGINDPYRATASFYAQKKVFLILETQLMWSKSNASRRMICQEQIALYLEWEVLMAPSSLWFPQCCHLYEPLWEWLFQCSSCLQSEGLFSQTRKEIKSWNWSNTSVILVFPHIFTGHPQTPISTAATMLVFEVSANQTPKLHVPGHQFHYRMTLWGWKDKKRPLHMIKWKLMSPS